MAFEGSPGFADEVENEWMRIETEASAKRKMEIKKLADKRKTEGDHPAA